MKTLEQQIAELQSQLQAVEAERDEFRAILEVIHKYQARFWVENGVTSMRIAKALQPAKEQ